MKGSFPYCLIVYLLGKSKNDFLKVPSRTILPSNNLFTPKLLLDFFIQFILVIIIKSTDGLLYIKSKIMFYTQNRTCADEYLWVPIQYADRLQTNLPT